MTVTPRVHCASVFKTRHTTLSTHKSSVQRLRGGSRSTGLTVSPHTPHRSTEAEARVCRRVSRLACPVTCHFYRTESLPTLSHHLSSRHRRPRTQPHPHREAQGARQGQRPGPADGSHALTPTFNPRPVQRVLRRLTFPPLRTRARAGVPPARRAPPRRLRRSRGARGLRAASPHAHSLLGAAAAFCAFSRPLARLYR